MTHIKDALIAYAAGDAFGVFHEFNPESPRPVPNTLLPKDGWPYGGISDDTLLTLLTIKSLQESSPARAAARFIEELHLAAPTLRGLGPTTRHALGLDVKESEQYLIGKSNGGMMRSALLGLAFTPENSAERDTWVSALVQCTHSDQEALATALEMAAIFTMVGSRPDKEVIPQPDRHWQPNPDGTSLDPRDTFNAVLSVVHQARSTAEAYMLACGLGGDTDTVAALSGALTTLVLRENSGLRQIPWLSDVGWDEIPTLDQAATTLENFSQPTTWIIGPLAWDTVVYLPSELVGGGFVQGEKTIERPGGTGANVAIGLSTTGSKVGFIGYVGDDGIGTQLKLHLHNSKIAQLHLQEFTGASNHVLIMITPNGERSMIGLSADRLDEIAIESEIFGPQDTVVFVQWRDAFAPAYQKLKTLVRRTVVGIEALRSTAISGADIVVGSHQDLDELDIDSQTFGELLAKFPTIVVTYGEGGAKEFSLHDGSLRTTFQPIFQVEEVIDATGAGDSFLAGYLRGQHQPPVRDSEGRSRSPLELGARWAALAVTQDQSFPPDWALLGLD